MVVVQMLVGILLSLLRGFASLKAYAWERAYMKHAEKCGQLETKAPCYTSGAEYAKHNFKLGRVAGKRDDCEEKYLSWQTTAERIGRWCEGIKNWSGRKLPYTLGAIDVYLVLAILDYYHFGQFLSLGTVLEGAGTGLDWVCALPEWAFDLVGL